MKLKFCLFVKFVFQSHESFLLFIYLFYSIFQVLGQVREFKGLEGVNLDEIFLSFKQLSNLPLMKST